MSKCCIYCRIAGKDTEANRIAMEAQANDLRDAADRLGMEVVEVRCFYEYPNDAERESIAGMIEDGKAGAFDTILVRNPGRLGRDTHVLNDIGEALHEAGLELYTPEGRAHIMKPTAVMYCRVATKEQLCDESPSMMGMQL